jgi:electron transfer flavoprotein alpha subunit
MISVARPTVLRAARSQLHPSRPIFAFRLSAVTRLLSTLAVLEQRGGKLSASSLSAIAAAQKLGGSVTGFVAGSGVKSSAAAEAAKIKGVEKVIAVDDEAYEKVR